MSDIIPGAVNEQTLYLHQVLAVILTLPPPQALIYGTHQWRI